MSEFLRGDPGDETRAAVPAVEIADLKSWQYRRLSLIKQKYYGDYMRAIELKGGTGGHLRITRVDEKGNTFRLKVNDDFFNGLEITLKALAEDAQDYYLFSGMELGDSR